jgi:hypothetical protein
MKKFYTLASVLTIAVAANAQQPNSKMSTAPSNVHVKTGTPKIITPSTQAIGDTTFLFDGFYVYDVAGNLPTSFTIETEDIDNAQVAANLQASSFGPTSSFVFFYEENPTATHLHYGHPDSVFFAGATSWFNPVGQADNWLEMGPIPVPANGAHLQWRHNMPDGLYRDGYEVLLSTTGMANYNDFTNPPIFNLGDMHASTAGDTVNFPYNDFPQRQADIPSSFNGQDIYIAFHHDATDMFILYLTDIMMIEGTLGLTENVNGLSVAQNMPNPFRGTTEINYSLNKAVDAVELTIYDVAGKKVKEVKEEQVGAGKHFMKVNSAEMAAGVYYYTLKAGETSVTKKMVVID